MILNTSYKVTCDVLDSESNKSIEDGTLHIYDGQLRMHIDGEIKSVSGGINTSQIIFVGQKSDFPSPSGGIITLSDNVTYYITDHIDLLGDRLVGGSDTVLIGGSSENCSLTSTGLSAGTPLLYSEYTTPIRHITIKSVDTAIGFDGSDRVVALDWTGVNFLDVPNVGTIDTCDNFIFSKGALLNSQGLIFTGTLGTIGFDNSIFRGDGTSGAIVTLDASCVVTRRFRTIYSSFIAFGSTVAVDVNASATIPTEAFILDTINFSGGSTYLGGLNHTSNDSLFINCVGITNTAVNGQLYMQGNATATTISNTTDFFKVLGTTTPSSDNSKFSHSNNRLTCDATISRKYLIQCMLSFTSGNANVCEFGFYDSQLAAVRTPSRTKSTANASGRAENVVFGCIVQMDLGDYLEIHAKNITTTNSITVDQLNFTITEIK